MPSDLYPFDRLIGDIVISASDLRIDGIPAPESAVNAADSSVAIHSLQKKLWNEATMSVAVQYPEQELRERGLDANRVSVMLQFVCNPTDTRATDLLQMNGGSANGEVVVKRDLVSGVAQLTAYLCLLGDDGIPLILGESETWKLSFLEPSQESLSGPRPPKGPTGFAELFKTKWERFSQDQPEKYKDRLFLIDVAGDQPTILLNEDIERYKSLMSDRQAASRYEKTLRDMEARRIAHAAWLAAIVEALENTQLDEDGALKFPNGWRRTVLETILQRMRPDQTVEQSAMAICEHRNNGNGYGTWLTDMDAIVEQMIEATQTVRRAMANVTNDGDE
jgi:hypothetical protein